MEEEYIKNLCAQILKFKPDLVITEKGLSDLAIHYLSKAGVSAIRRLRKTDNNRIAKACGAVIVNRPEELQESDVGTGAGLFEVKKIGDEFFAFIVDCKDPKACTVLLRGASKDVLNEVERNLQVFPHSPFSICLLLLVGRYLIYIMTSVINSLQSSILAFCFLYRL
jgi:T-complex protein 1 subunit gamma